jgi:hypothetical protein
MNTTPLPPRVVVYRFSDKVPNNLGTICFIMLLLGLYRNI